MWLPGWRKPVYSGLLKIIIRVIMTEPEVFHIAIHGKRFLIDPGEVYYKKPPFRNGWLFKFVFRRGYLSG